MTHFEDLWNKAEDINSFSTVEEDIKNLQDLFIKLQNQLLNKEPSFDTQGEILYVLSAISKKTNCDVYKALQERIEKEMDTWE